MGWQISDLITRAGALQGKSGEEAELHGLIKSLKCAKEQNVRVALFCDNVNIVRRITSKDNMVDWKLLPMFDEILLLSQTFDRFACFHVDRLLVSAADGLAKLALDRRLNPFVSEVHKSDSGLAYHQMEGISDLSQVFFE